jgi:NADH-quinone oxidoreductase subunit G
VLDALAREFDVELGCADAARIRREIGMTPPTEAPRPGVAAAEAVVQPRPKDGEAILATWHHLLDLGAMTDGDDYLLGTARTPAVRIGKALAPALGVGDGDAVTVGTERGAITLPAEVTEMADGVVWLPTNSPGSTVNRLLAATSGDVVTVSPGGVA